jgi:hypothetical protein
MADPHSLNRLVIGTHGASGVLALTEARRNLLILGLPGRGGPHGSRPGHQFRYSVGFDFDERIRAVLPRLPAPKFLARPTTTRRRETPGTHQTLLNDHVCRPAPPAPEDPVTMALGISHR